MRKANDKNIYQTLVNLKNTLAGATDSAKTQASEMLSELLEDMSSVKTEARGYTEQYVKSYPLKSLGIAAAFGFCIGKFIL